MKKLLLFLGNFLSKKLSSSSVRKSNCTLVKLARHVADALVAKIYRGEQRKGVIDTALCDTFSKLYKELCQICNYDEQSN